MPQSPRLIRVGRIIGAHGIKGEVVIQASTERPEDVAAYGPLCDAEGRQAVLIESARATGKGVVARLAGITDRNAAEALKGTDLYVPRDRLPAAAEGEYYVSDLIGLEACDPSGMSIGRVVDVPNYGAGDLLEIDPGNGRPTLLVTITETTVPEIDVAAHRIVVVMPGEVEDERDNG
jgi:16S rRNA processing protein RimM